MVCVLAASALLVSKGSHDVHAAGSADEDTIDFVGTVWVYPAITVAGTSGTFRIEATDCTMTSEPDSGPCLFAGNGTFDFSACATGTMSATTIDVAGPDSGTMSITATVAGGSGTLTGTMAESDAGTVAGSMQMIPNQGNCISGVVQFVVTVELAIT